MSKWKWAALFTAIALVTAPVSTALADTTPVPAPAPTPAPTPGDMPPPPPPEDGGMCTDDGDDEDDNGNIPPAPEPAPTPVPEPTPAPGGDTGGTTGQPSVGFEKDHGKDHGKDKDQDKHGDGKDKDHHGNPGNVSNPPCHDNGHHKGWTNKINNMVKRLEELKKQLNSLEKKLEQLKAWAKQNGSSSDQDALKQIEEALKALDSAGEAQADDLVVLADTQDQLQNPDGAIRSLEKALTLDYKNADTYTRLSKQHQKKGDTKDVKVYVTGKKPAFDVQPVILEGRTLVPLRAIGTALNADVKWDEATQTVTLTNKDGRIVTLQIDSKQATVDGQPVTLDVPAKKLNDRTLVPLRALGNFFHLEVNWDESSQMAILK
ncbi:copper amine oxidase N-terminal domain-containing protein [Tumebacillus permanentifrigoris]|uniref:Copper amine oxidase-like protein n=1 Tax=Tumebacillus permanentifrigoris TaxID=378543 RepID=A0A316DG58_9BACL|nr:copper amine oxidase N-terminal domain-containing protein [Tumebacillus permanentifrigoris]PWK16219.1 copper amine oxidase-like protein [Tumebacillus permanentifrigoris]